MAREDVIPQLMRQLMQKEGPPAESDNSILQKMIVPQDSASLADSVTTSKNTPANITWGSSYTSGNYTWVWGQGQWG